MPAMFSSLNSFVSTPAAGVALMAYGMGPDYRPADADEVFVAGHRQLALWMRSFDVKGPSGARLFPDVPQDHSAYVDVYTETGTNLL
ncbi:hypothetical protein [Achromobacter sp.]|uniref:hypothetical protein n=1 Tax=Achromobacter sp. TaxID=134375 RepID=UPI0028A90D9D|nr:hypothetical protein [Achromobacter sp.]